MRITARHASAVARFAAITETTSGTSFSVHVARMLSTLAVGSLSSALSMQSASLIAMLATCASLPLSASHPVDVAITTAITSTPANDPNSLPMLPMRVLPHPCLTGTLIPVPEAKSSKRLSNGFRCTPSMLQIQFTPQR